MNHPDPAPIKPEEDPRYQLHYDLSQGKWCLRYYNFFVYLSTDEALAEFKNGRSFTLDTSRLLSNDVIAIEQDVRYL